MAMLVSPATAAPAPNTLPDDEAPAVVATPLSRGALERELQALAAEHADLARLIELGRTRSHHAIQALVLGADMRNASGPLDERTGLLLLAGLDGRRASDTNTLIETARQLLDRPADELTAALGQHVLVIVPRVNHDGTDASLGSPGALPREQFGNGLADDADRDGRVDEDGPADLDGDGVIGWMRIPDSEGEWVIDEHDPRALRKAKRSEGERGTHRVQLEGRDDDGDGQINEDGTQGVHSDRQFAHGWDEHAAASGAYPLSEPESHAVAQMLLDNPWIVGVLVVGDQDTLASLPSKAKKLDRGGFRNNIRAPLDGVMDDDLDTLTEFKRRFDEALEDADEHEVKADALTDGSLLAWAYHHAGRWPLALKVWEPPAKLPKSKDAAESNGGDDAEVDGDDDADDAESDDDDDDGAGVDVDDDVDPDSSDATDAESVDEADADKPSSDKHSPVPAAVLAWLDAEREGAGFLPWTPFDHPDLGPIHIGGFAPGVTTHAPAEAIEAVSQRLAPFVLDLLGALPVLAFEDVEVEARGGNTYVVKAVLVNTGALPTAPKLAEAARTARPIRVRPLLADGAALLNGPEQVLVGRLEGAGGRHELRWVLTAPAGSTLRIQADADSVADIEVEIELK